MLKKIVILLYFIVLISCSSTDKQGDYIDRDPYDSIHVNALQNNQEDNKLRVAILLPLSGNAEQIGKSMLKAAELSMFNNKINNIVLMPYDTKGTRYGAIDAINMAIREGIDIVLGPFFTETTKAILDIAEANNLIVISFSDNQAILNKKHPNLYLMGLTPKQEMYRMISYLIDYRHMYGFSAMFSNDMYGDLNSKIFKEIMFRKDARAVKTEFYSKNDKVLQRKVNNLLNTHIYRDDVYKKYNEDKAIAKVEGLSNEVEFTYTEQDKIYAGALIIPDSGKELTQIGSYVANYVGSHKPLLVGTSKWLNNDLYNDKNFNNTLFASPNPATYALFDDMYYQVYQVYPLRVSSLAYDAVTSVIESYAKAQSKTNFKYALENYQGFDGINGKFRFLSDGLVERKLAIVRIINGRFEIINYDNEPFLKY